MLTFTYALQQLYVDQEHDWVVDTIPAVLAWVPGKSRARLQQPFQFMVEHAAPESRPQTIQISLSWDAGVLANHDPQVAARATRMREGHTAQREHVTELAAYGLSFVAISVLMPGRRVIHMRKGLPPDLLFDVTPRALRGVEAAGRASGGAGALVTICEGTPAAPGKPAIQGKVLQLQLRTDIAEAHLSLWCASPRVAMVAQVKP